MSATNDPPSPPPGEHPPAPPASRKSHHGLFYFLTALLLVGGWFAVVYVLPAYMPALDKLAPRAGPADNAKIDELDRKVQALDNRVNDLGARIDSFAMAPNPSSTASTAQNAKAAASGDLAHVQGDLASLSATVRDLQAGVKEAGSMAAALRSATQNALAEAIAYIQLREAAAEGRGFAKEFAVLRDATKNDPAFAEPIAKLAPFAEKGAPTVAQLREQLGQQTGEIEVAIAKTNAHEWWERILAEFRGLVSIRPLHGAEPDDDMPGMMDQSLTQDDLADALQQMKSLPPDAQKTLAGWRASAEARQQIDDALHVMADRLAAGAKTAAPPPEPSAPAPPQIEAAPNTLDAP